MSGLIRNAVAIFGAAILLILATPLTKWATQLLAAPWGRDDAPVLVVLGGEMLIPGTGPNATLGFDTYLRCTMAAAVVHQSSYRYIVVTGAWGLSHAMARFLIAHGVEKSKILEENAARSTHENALFTKKILTSIYGEHFPRVVVLTSDFHSRRALLTFRRAGLDASAVPAPDLIKRTSTRTFRLEAAQILAIELVALASYELKGYA